MALKKSHLYSSLWKSCDELRGGMDASQYKDYVLTMLFVKYVSDKAADGRTLMDVPEGGSFADMVALKGDPEIGDRMNKVIARLAEANGLRGVIDLADFNDEDKLGKGKAMVDRLSNLVGIFEGLDLSANLAGGDDLLGDPSESLMRHFATESGKSKGQFYTPAEVSRILAKVVGVGAQAEQDGQDVTAYDPTCGSGSLLLKLYDEAGTRLTLYGQEKDNATAALARMNMILHGAETAEIWKDDTLAEPYWKDADGDGRPRLKRFDFAVANPPFSTKSWTNGLDPENDPYERFSYDAGRGATSLVPPTKNGDYAFLLHVLASLKSTGRAAVILPHGVLFRGNAEGTIRESLIKRGLIEGVIGLPANLFYGTGIPACIVVLDKRGARTRDAVFLVDASRGFRKDGPKNRLREQDIHRVVDTYRERRDAPGYARLVPLSEIAGNDYNLNLPRYVDGSEVEDLHDLEAHLRGGIPDRDLDGLSAYWDVMPGLRAALFEPERPGYSRLRVDASDLKDAVLGHPEFQAFAGRVRATFETWRDAHRPGLLALDVGASPHETIAALSEDLLARFDGTPLLDPYDLYQHLMDFWAETMQDDVYLVAQDGWCKAAQPRTLVPRPGQKTLDETPDLVVGARKVKLDLVPPALVVARYFADEKAQVDALEAKAEAAGAAVDEFVEEHAGEDGLLEDARSDTGKITKGSLKARLAEIGRDRDAAEERDALRQCDRLMSRETTAKKKAKDAQKALDAEVLATYPRLSEDEVKALVVDGKWLAAAKAAVDDLVGVAECEATGRVEDLEKRYSRSMHEVAHAVSEAERAVVRHLEAIEATWV